MGPSFFAYYFTQGFAGAMKSVLEPSQERGFVVQSLPRWQPAGGEKKIRKPTSIHMKQINLC